MFGILLLLTPIFGFELQLDAPPPPSTVAVSADVTLAETANPEDAGQQTTSDSFAGHLDVAPIAAAATSEEANAAPVASPDSVLTTRAKRAGIHRALGIATWAAMTLTQISGAIQFYNRFGGSSFAETPCARGEAVLQGASCDAPYLHLTTAAVTTGLYLSTFALSLTLPSPDGLDQGDSEYARTLRLHKTLRWIHGIGMVSQVLLGLITANVVDAETDYGTARALGAVHMSLGLVTYAALTWSGLLFLF